MATITKTSMNGAGAIAAVITTLGASDTFVFDESKNPVMVLTNVTVGALTPNFDGDGATQWPANGIGNVDVSSGLTLASIAAGDSVVIQLNTIKAYLQGTIAMTGADAMECQILEF